MNKYSENKYDSVMPIMKNLFNGYENYPFEVINPSIINDEMIYMINLMIISDNKKFNKLLNTDKILDVEVHFNNTNDKKLNISIVFNKEFGFECKFDAHNKAERRTVYEAFEMGKQIIVWNLDSSFDLIRVQKISFNFTGYLNVFNKYIMQV